MTSDAACEHGYPIGHVIPCNDCWADRLELHVALHDFATRMARGEVRHPVQETTTDRSE